MVTREEKHTTRGRARMLFEMMAGDPIRKGWRDEEVKEALDLCLACKGCKGDCPVNVDMATYKAEFLSHYYSRRLRPRTAYAMGLIYWAAGAASRSPRLVNLATHASSLSGVFKRIAGMAPQREIPRFAHSTLRKRLADRPRGNVGGSPVLLWPDTFTNHFDPQIGEAAVDVLEAAGFQVLLPGRPLCCGRPLYDYGMLRLAKRQLRQILARLRPLLEEGMPVVGLEPSCVAVFRDELINLFPRDRDAERLSSQTFTLAEFLVRKAPDFSPPLLNGKAMVQVHCHHGAIMGFTEERKLLERLGLEVEVLDSGCCGMAGSFGFQAGDHYEISMKCAERVLLPAVRDATEDTIVVANGFSCRQQIYQGAGRTAYHLAEVIRDALQVQPSRKSP
jgi:Fe-S oxidoreductase